MFEFNVANKINHLLQVWFNASHTRFYDNILCAVSCCSPIGEGIPAAAYSRVVDDVEFLSFLEGEVIFSASVIVIQSYEEGDSTTCGHDQEAEEVSASCGWYKRTWITPMAIFCSFFKRSEGHASVRVCRHPWNTSAIHWDCFTHFGIKTKQREAEFLCSPTVGAASKLLFNLRICLHLLAMTFAQDIAH